MPKVIFHFVNPKVSPELEPRRNQMIGHDSMVTTAVVVPQVVCHDLDPHTGIPFMPHIAAHFVGALRDEGFGVQVFDCFGAGPHRRILLGEFMLMGQDVDWILDNLSTNTKVCYIYCRTIAEFVAVERIIAALKKYRPEVKVVLFENVQAVTSYSLRPVAQEWIDKGVDLVLLGEPEDRAGTVTRLLFSGGSFANVPGIACRDPATGGTVVTDPAPLRKDLDAFAMPAWDLFQLDGYWRVGFAHAPCSERRFLPILTSRGCPFRCTFCIAPSVNPEWRARSPSHVVDEMEHFYRTLGISDFHISDLNPTVQDKRTQAICKEIIARNLPITWKLAQGTKIESIKSEETIDLMARAGCVFVSFSPESGSKRLLGIMNKPFDHDHALRMARRMHQLGIRMQAVFIGGVPGEEEDDRQQSLDYARKLLDAGVDEISLVIFTPLPGAALANSIKGFHHYSQCTPSPNWRPDYKELLRYRRRMYLQLFRHRFSAPRELLATLVSIVRRRFATKMEMSIYKQGKLYMLHTAPALFSQRVYPAAAEVSANSRRVTE